MDPSKLVQLKPLQELVFEVVFVSSEPVQLVGKKPPELVPGYVTWIVLTVNKKQEHFKTAI